MTSVVIIGGGIIGSSVAFFLKEIGFAGKVTVLEKDPSYRFSSTTRSAASIRQQFTTPVSTEMSQFGFTFMADLKKRFGIDGDIGLNEGGYLLLADVEHDCMLRECHAQFVKLGSDIAWLDQNALKSRFPWLNVDDLTGGTLGLSGEGWFDAHLFLNVYRMRARERGVEYVQAEAISLARTGNRVISIGTKSGAIVPCDIVVNAAGPAAGIVAAMAGIDLPVEPRKRTLFVFKGPLDPKRVPMVFDPSGFGMRPEGNSFLIGMAPPADRDPHPENDFEPDHYLFEEYLWPALAHRIPALDQLRLERSWAGHYEMNLFDHNGVVGSHPEVENFLFANGFSGHGVMHSPATGRGIAELIVYHQFQSIDLTPLSFERLIQNKPIHENLVY
jgi:FAD-dependent oxidoreductase domain-containing protein 1